MSKDKKKKKYTHSLRRQITLIFVGIMALTLLALFLATHFFLEKYYFNNKEKTLFSVYDLIKFSSAGGTMSTDEFDVMLQKNSGTHSVSIVIISSGFEPVKIYAMEPQDQLLRELANNLRGTVYVKRVIKETDDYVLVLKNDNRTKTDFLEMWGALPDGSFFMLRSAMESIKNSAEIAARFLLIIGFCVMTVSAVIIFLFTRKISKPILELADISEKMSNMDFDARYKGKEKTEIAILGNSINKMSENLESTIAELKEANIELKKDNDLKTEIDNMRTEFIANVSHELKTPIALIQGYAEGLKEGVNEAEERDYYCDVISDEAGKMNNMVKQLLLLNQLESGFDTLNIDRFDIVALINNYVQSAEILTKSSDIKVTVPDCGPVYVWADEFKVEEIIMNFFSNAVHYCKSDSEKRIDVSVEKGENKVKITVFNTGDHIPEESIAHLWDKFYKVDKARSREYGGSGVGLSIVKAITDSLGETCGVSNVTDGVAFWFTLDCTDR